MRTRKEILEYNREYQRKNKTRLVKMAKIRYKHQCKNCNNFFYSRNKIQDCCSLSCAALGKRNRNWKGGISPLRQRLSSSKEWKSLVKLIYKKFGNICQKCYKKISNRKGKKHIHHLKGFKNKEEFFNIDKITLWCQHCHLSYHSNENLHRQQRKKST